MKMIYAIKHNITQRIYIGCTANTARIRKHISQLSNGKHSVELMQNDSDQFGLNFSVYELEIVSDEDCKDAETKWMHYFDTGNPAHGYNYKDRKAQKKSIESFPVYDQEKWLKEIRGFEKTHGIGLYERFIKLLKERNCTVSMVCEETGINCATFSHWKSGYYTPTGETIYLICQYFNVPMDYFYR